MNQELEADEENVIRYMAAQIYYTMMAGYIPFKLLQVYKRKTPKK